MKLQPRLETLAALIAAGIICLALPQAIGAAEAAGAMATGPAAGGADNSLCLARHAIEDFAMPGADGQMRSLHVIRDKFESRVHGTQLCVACHKDITAIPRGKAGSIKVSCVQCHEGLWAAARTVLREPLGLPIRNPLAPLARFAETPSQGPGSQRLT